MTCEYGGAMALSLRWGRGAVVVVVLMLVLVLVPFPARAAGPLPSAAECTEAYAIIQLGDPGAAIQAVKEVREARPVAAGQTPRCEPEYTEAARRQARAVALVQRVDQLPEPVPTKSSDAASPTPTASPTPKSPQCPDEALDSTITTKTQAVKAALACDPHNAEAASLAETLPATGATTAQAAEKTWTGFKDRWLDPWAVVLLGFLVWGAVVLAGARLLLVVLGNVPAQMMSRRDYLRPLILTVATIALIVGGVWWSGLDSVLQETFTSWAWAALALIVVGIIGLVTFGSLFSESPRTGPGRRRRRIAQRGKVVTGLMLLAGAVIGVVQIPWLSLQGQLAPNPRIGAVLGVVSAVLFAVGWSVGRGLTIISTGGDAPTAEYLRSLTKRLAPNAPRGVEVPRGTDADVLTQVGIVAGSSTPLVAALARLISLLTPPTPWQLHVTAHSKDVLTAELSRNHRHKDSVVIDRVTVFKTFESAEGTADMKDSRENWVEAVDLAPFPAALAVMRIAEEHHITQGLAGATKWRSLASQYLAAQQPHGSEAAKALFAHAVATDEKNTLASVGYWHSLYRESTNIKTLQRYRDWLDQALGPNPKADSRTAPQTKSVLNDEPALRMRVLYTRVAVGINLSYVGGNHYPFCRSVAAWDPGLPTRAAQLKELTENNDIAIDPEFRATMYAEARALTCSVPSKVLAEEMAEIREVWVPTVPANATLPEAHGPKINYSLACYYADLGADRELAVDHLELADRSPTLRSWRKRDPQLATLQKKPEYRTRFGQALPTDPLSIAPFSDYAPQLRAMGLVTLDHIAKAPPRWLMNADIDRATAVWLRASARLGIQIRKQKGLKGWELAILTTMVARGQRKPPRTPKEREALCKKLIDDLRSYRESPDRARLEAWLCR